MKKLISKNLLAAYLLFSTSIGFAQKPTIGVTFKMDTNGVLYQVLQGKVPEFENEAQSILIAGLNKYVGFAKFLDGQGEYHLDFVMKRKFQNNSLYMREYWLEAILTDTLGNRYDDYQWLFLSAKELSDYLGSLDLIPNKLNDDWQDSLSESPYVQIVSSLFHNIAIKIENRQCFYVDDTSGVKDLILPFRQENLSIDPAQSKFKVCVHGKDLSNVNNTYCSNDSEGGYSGYVDGNMSGLPQKLKGCIRLNVKGSNIITFENGEVYIKNYRRKDYSTMASTDDFFNDN